MKSIYISPEFEMKKFEFSEMMSNINVSQPENFESSGFDDNDDDIG